MVESPRGAVHGLSSENTIVIAIFSSLHAYFFDGLPVPSVDLISPFFLTPEPKIHIFFHIRNPQSYNPRIRRLLHYNPCTLGFVLKN
jgi:hypothetical protein